MGGALRRGMGFWNGLAGPSRRMIIGAVVIFIVGLFLLMRLSGSVAYSTLNEAPLQAAEAKAAAEQLTELGIPYRFTEGGASIEVPTDQRSAASMELRAAQVLGGGGGPGWELFDKSNLGATDFTQRVNLVRAMEGELSRTIGRLDPVDSAIVKIAMPQERLFTSEQQATTASVVLGLAPGAMLDAGQVKGITRLVAMSIPGLKAEDITITDGAGNILEGGATDAAGATAADTRMAIQRRYERETQGRLDAMLAAILGPGKAVTQVSAQLDLDKVTTETETFDDESATPLDRETSRERLRSEGGAAVGGAAGATANVPGTPGYNAAGAAGGDTDYLKTTERSRIGVDHTRSTIERTPGLIQSQAISVQVSDEVPAETVASLEEAVAAAVGFEERRDQISVQAVPFAAEGAAARAAAAAPPVAAEPGFDPMSLVKPGVAGLGVLLLLLLSRRSLRRRETALERALPELLAKGPVPVAELGAPGAAALATPTQPIAELEGQRKTPVEQQMEDLAMRKPDDVAQLLRGWLVEGR